MKQNLNPTLCLWEKEQPYEEEHTGRPGSSAILLDLHDGE